MPPIMANSKDGQYQKDKYLAKISTYTVLMIKKLWLISYFQKIPQKIKYQYRDPITRNIDVKYETHGQKVISNINVLKMYVKV